MLDEPFSQVMPVHVDTIKKIKIYTDENSFFDNSCNWND